jgi:uncharacterized protein YutD
MDHEISIAEIKKDITQIKGHELKYSKIFDSLDIAVRDFNVSIIKINSKLDSFDDVQEKIRKLEDKTILQGFIEKLFWFAIGAFISVSVSQQYISNREERSKHKTEQTK